MSTPDKSRFEKLQRWRSARKVLAVRLDNLGDLLMTTPALAAIRRALPTARLTLLTSAAGAAAAGHLPAVDAAIALAAPWVRQARGDPAAALAGLERAFIERLAAERFDAAIIFTVCTQSALPAALLCRLAGIPLRLAYSRENPYDLLSDWERDPDVLADGMRHEVARQLALVASVGFAPQDERLRFRYLAEDARRLHERLRAAACDPARPYFVVHPGATAPSRRYPAARFGAAAEIVGRESGALAIFTGGAGEQALIDEARRCMRTPSLSLAGQLDLGELAALITGAQVLLTNNTAPAHLAAAVDTPIVELYALTNPQHTPWRARARLLNHDVPCRNCLRSECPQGHHDCLRRVPPEAVAEAALALMGPGPGVPLPLSPFAAARRTPGCANAMEMSR